MLQESVKERAVAREIIADFIPITNPGQEEFTVCQIVNRLEEYGTSKWYQGRDDERSAIKSQLLSMIDLFQQTGVAEVAIRAVRLAHDNIKD